MTTTIEALKAARERIERGWCQGALARNAEGQSTHEEDPDAVAWCAGGATSLHQDALHMLRTVINPNSLGTWNDAPGRTKEEVLAAFDKAIRLAVADTSVDAECEARR